MEKFRRFLISLSLKRVMYLLIALIGLVASIAALAWYLGSPKKIVASQQLSEVANLARHLLIITFISGLLSMALVQVRKNLFRSRGYFHGNMLKWYLGEEVFYLLEPNNRYRSIASLLDIPLEQLIAQLASEFEELSLEPIRESNLLVRLGGSKAKRVLKDLELSENKNNKKKFLEAHRTLRIAVEQGLDRLQLVMNNRWQRRIRIEACIYSGLISAAFVALTPMTLWMKTSVIISCFIWGGFFAWLSRDILATLEKFRN